MAGPRALLVDLRPLSESRAFRAWWLGSSLSGFGSQLTAFAVLYYVWSTTHRADLLGWLAMAQIVPTVVAALVGGALADRVDRRRLVIATRFGQLAGSVALAVTVATGTAPVALVFVVVAIETGFGAAGAPANRSFTARLLSGPRLTAGLALSRLADQSSLLLGPMLAGVIILLWNVQTCFVIDAMTFLAAMYGTTRLPAMRPIESIAQPNLRGLRGAVHLVVRSPVLLGAFLTDLAATVLAMPFALFPVINEQVYGGSVVTLGLFAPAVGIGGILTSVLSGRVTASERLGRLMLCSAAVWAGSLACFAATHTLWIGLTFLAVAGAADTVTVVSRSSLVQQATPDAVRGRVNALDFLVGVTGPQLGNFRAGLVASSTSGATSAFLGGLASLAALGAIAVGTPSLRRYDAGAIHTASGSPRH
jgi:MFS family permease